MTAKKKGTPAEATVTWDDSDIRTAYANAVNVTSTREAVSLYFGVNRTWNPSADRNFEVGLTNRVLLSPSAAARFAELLGEVLQRHEDRFGELEVEAGT